MRYIDNAITIRRRVQCDSSTNATTKANARIQMNAQVLANKVNNEERLGPNY